MTILDIVLIVLKIINSVMNQINQDKLINTGKDIEIAAVTAAILRKTQAGKAIMERVDAMGSDDVDADLHKLEPQ